MTLSSFFEKLGIKPNNIDLFHEALTHTSFINEKRTGSSYQRLEFVGDSLLDMAVAKYLYSLTPKLNEGKMTVIRASVVNAEALAKISKSLGLDQLIRIGKGASEIINNTKVLSDLFESVSAAIYLDLGKDVFLSFMNNTIFKKIEEAKGQNLKNPKTILQEYLQADSRGNIYYETIENKKEKINRKFESKVYHDKIFLGTGFGKNTKVAEVEAAKDALKKWEGKNETN